MKKHIITACFVTPILAFLGYFSVDYFVGEKVQKAEVGKSYALIAKSNCRYSSGVCTMENGNFELIISLSDNNLFTIESHHFLTALEITVDDTQQYKFISDNAKTWTGYVTEAFDSNSNLRIVAAADKTLYFGETQMEFIHLKTLFDKPLSH